jgi:3-oxoacyl-[acyl-carrier-protein] synthase II
MAALSRRAVITGIGLLTPLGLDRAEVWNAVRQGQSGIRPIKGFDTSGLPVRIGGEIEDFDARLYLAKENRKSLRMMARPIQLAVSGAQLALDDSQIDKSKLDKSRFGVIYGAGLIATELLDLAEAARVSVPRPAPVFQPYSTPVDLEKWGAEGMQAIQPLWMLKYLPNMLACQVSILQDAQGHNNSITEGDVASLLAVGEAYRVLLRDRADFFLVGGAESKINPLSMTRQCLYEHISRCNEEPARACRPFDKHRTGLVLGEGAGTLAIEDLEHARQRGATIHAEIVGFGAAFDHRRDGAGIARALAAALHEAEVNPADVDHINAHGLATTHSDIWEARGLREFFGARVPPVFGPKSYLGNLGAASTTTELALSLLGMEHGVTLPTLNFETPDPQCPLPVLAGSPRPMDRPYVVKLNFNQLGQCGALVLRRWE